MPPTAPSAHTASAPEGRSLALTLRQVISRGAPGAEAVLADLDGTLLAAGQLRPEARDLADAAGERLWIVSNNASDTAQGLSLRLQGLGLAVPAQRILLAGEETLRRLAQDRPGQRVALYANPSLRALARALGLVPDHTLPETAVLAQDRAFGLDALAELAGLVSRGVPFWVTDATGSTPGPGGRPMPGTGALLAALMTTVPDVRVTSLGLPAPDLAELALHRAAVRPVRAVMLGHSQTFSGAAAARAGIPFLLVTPPGPDGRT